MLEAAWIHEKLLHEIQVGEKMKEICCHYLQFALETHQAESNSLWSLIMLADAWHMIMTNYNYKASGRTYWHSCIWQLKNKEKNKKNQKPSQTCLKVSDTFMGVKKQVFPPYSRSIFKVYIILSPSHFSPPSPTVPLLQYYSYPYVVSIKWWQLRKLELIYSSKKYEVLFLPLGICKLI